MDCAPFGGLKRRRLALAAPAIVAVKGNCRQEKYSRLAGKLAGLQASWRAARHIFLAPPIDVFEEAVL
jgi:hypothetical protein